jgi:hypothetical protein
MGAKLAVVGKIKDRTSAERSRRYRQRQKQNENAVTSPVTQAVTVPTVTPSRRCEHYRSRVILRCPRDRASPHGSIGDARSV